MKRVLFVTSRVNIASHNIYERLLEQYVWKDTKQTFDDSPIYEMHLGGVHVQLISAKKGVLELEYVGKVFAPDLYIVASTHTSSSGTKTLSAHATGNFGEAILGGSPNEICPTSATFISDAIRYFLAHPLPGYEVTLEVTHHGPSTMNAPLVFIEIGSGEEEWKDVKAAELVAQTMVACVEKPSAKPVAVCFGGPHYAPRFIKPYVLERVQVGHICSRHMLDSLNEKTLKQMIEATEPHATYALIAWKGMNGAQRQRLLGMLQETDLNVLKVEKLKTINTSTH